MDGNRRKNHTSYASPRLDGHWGWNGNRLIGIGRSFDRGGQRDGLAPLVFRGIFSDTDQTAPAFSEDGGDLSIVERETATRFR